MSTTLDAFPTKRGTTQSKLKQGCKYIVDLLKLHPERAKERYSLCRKLADHLDLKVTSLYSKVERALEPKQKVHGNNLLTRDQECQLVGFALALRQSGEPADKTQVCCNIHIYLY